MTITIQSTDTIREAAREFIANMGDATIFAFYGGMGAGKTTFIKAICEELGVEDVITSPTFAIVNEYTISSSAPASITTNVGNTTPAPASTNLAAGDSVFHFDFYRIKREEEVYDIGYEDYIDSGCLCFMEWPELIENLLPYDAVKVTITQNPDGTRTVEF